MALQTHCRYTNLPYLTEQQVHRSLSSILQRNPPIVYARYVDKMSSREDRQRRAIIVSFGRLILLQVMSSGVKMKRYIPTSAISKLMFSRTVYKGKEVDQVLIKIPSEYDLLIEFCEDQKNTRNTNKGKPALQFVELITKIRMAQNTEPAWLGCDKFEPSAARPPLRSYAQLLKKAARDYKSPSQTLKEHQKLLDSGTLHTKKRITALGDEPPSVVKPQRQPTNHNRQQPASVPVKRILLPQEKSDQIKQWSKDTADNSYTLPLPSITEPVDVRGTGSGSGGGGSGGNKNLLLVPQESALTVASFSSDGSNVHNKTIPAIGTNLPEKKSDIPVIIPVVINNPATVSKPKPPSEEPPVVNPTTDSKLSSDVSPVKEMESNSHLKAETKSTEPSAVKPQLASLIPDQKPPPIPVKDVPKSKTFQTHSTTAADLKEDSSSEASTIEIGSDYGLQINVISNQKESIPTPEKSKKKSHKQQHSSSSSSSSSNRESKGKNTSKEITAIEKPQPTKTSTKVEESDKEETTSEKPKLVSQPNDTPKSHSKEKQSEPHDVIVERQIVEEEEPKQKVKKESKTKKPKNIPDTIGYHIEESSSSSSSSSEKKKKKKKKTKSKEYSINTTPIDPRRRTEAWSKTVEVPKREWGSPPRPTWCHIEAVGKKGQVLYKKRLIKLDENSLQLFSSSAVNEGTPTNKILLTDVITVTDASLLDSDMESLRIAFSVKTRVESFTCITLTTGDKDAWVFYFNKRYPETRG